jgi:hypothetical protein
MERTLIEHRATDQVRDVLIGMATEVTIEAGLVSKAHELVMHNISCPEITCGNDAGPKVPEALAYRD